MWWEYCANLNISADGSVTEQSLPKMILDMLRWSHPFRSNLLMEILNNKSKKMIYSRITQSKLASYEMQHIIVEYRPLIITLWTSIRLSKTPNTSYYWRAIGYLCVHVRENRLHLIAAKWCYMTWIWINIGSDNVSLPVGTTKLPDLMLTYHDRCSVVFSR